MAIKCEHYDYIEIACMFRFPLKICLKNGETIEGLASGIEKNTSKQECLRLENDSSSDIVVMDNISSIKVMVENPHFDEVEFD
ncbi:Rho-binding antiterminator [Agaribacter flavus]|uniref:Rho-binding antiterminator n=1 Tax=Agaribacter flavus TaxID=1902781 RepID=A0ABV7FIZ6_9ALTE